MTLPSTRAALFGAVALVGLACGPQVRLPPASRPATPAAAAPSSMPASASQPASVPASASAPASAGWPTARCQGLLRQAAPTATAAPALDAREVPGLVTQGRALLPRRLLHVVVARQGGVELHRRKYAAARPGDGRASRSRRRDGAAGASPDYRLEDGVVCSLVGEADLLPAAGCERLYLCVADVAYALVVEAEGRLEAATGATLRLLSWEVGLVDHPEGGGQIAWRVTEAGQAASHRVGRVELLRVEGRQLRQVFGSVETSTLAHGGARGSPWSAAGKVARCRFAPTTITCGARRWCWEPTRSRYLPAPSPGRVAYRPVDLATGRHPPVWVLRAVLRAAAARGIRVEGRGFRCAEADRGHEVWSRWPAPRAGTSAPAWHVVVEEGRVRVERLDLARPVDPLLAAPGVTVPEGYDYQRERDLVTAIRAELQRSTLPAGGAGLCEEGFGRAIAGYTLGTSLERVRRREKRWRRRCTTSRHGPRLRLTCRSRDRVVRVYQLVDDQLVGVVERFPRWGAQRRLERAQRRWTGRFGAPTLEGPPEAPTGWSWSYAETVLGIRLLPDHTLLFYHRRSGVPAMVPEAAPRQTRRRGGRPGRRR